MKQNAKKKKKKKKNKEIRMWNLKISTPNFSLFSLLPVYSLNMNLMLTALFTFFLIFFLFLLVFSLFPLLTLFIITIVCIVVQTLMHSEKDYCVQTYTGTQLFIYMEVCTYHMHIYIYLCALLGLWYFSISLCILSSNSHCLHAYGHHR